MKYLRNASVAVALAVSVIAGWEGKENRAYLDLVNVPTICYGTTKNVKLGDVKTDTECTRLLTEEVNRIDRYLDKLVHVPLQPHERAALISFAYNVGDGALARSTAVKRFNAGDATGGCNAIATKSYVNGVCQGYGCGWAGGKMVRGLQNRRQSEKLLCLGE